MASDEDKVNLLETFKALDLNGDGMVSRQELIQGYGQMSDVNMSEKELNQLFDNIDKDNSGKIDYSEFVSASINR